jgi:hypothetical protein
MNSVPEEQKVLVSLLLYTLFIVLYAVFIWKFYRFMAEKDIIKFNLSQYNRSKSPALEKSYALLLNILQYLIILPFLVLFWFTVFSILLLILSKSQSTYQILLITAAIIASTRVAAYLNEGLSRDLAKIFPFTVLALFILDPDFFNINILFDKFVQVPEIFSNILIFVVFIFGIELILRLVYSFAAFIYSKRGEPMEQKVGKSFVGGKVSA